MWPYSPKLPKQDPANDLILKVSGYHAHTPQKASRLVSIACVIGRSLWSLLIPTTLNRASSAQMLLASWMPWSHQLPVWVQEEHLLGHPPPASGPCRGRCGCETGMPIHGTLGWVGSRLCGCEVRGKEMGSQAIKWDCFGHQTHHTATSIQHSHNCYDLADKCVSRTICQRLIMFKIVTDK